MHMYETIVSNWQKKNIKTGAELSEALDDFMLDFAYNSCKIENDKVTYEDVCKIFNNL